MAKRTKIEKLVAEICLYGNREIGTGYLYQTASGKSGGDGEPRQHVGCTDAVLHAFNDLRACGITSGRVRIYAPGGKFMAEVGLNEFVYYGNLPWQPAKQIEVSMEAVLVAAAS